MLRILQYNVLSSGLCSPSYYPRYDPKHLDSKNRLKILKEKLKPLLDGQTILTLQEVSREWYGELLAFSDALDYKLIHSSYGPFFDGYMGCAILVPRNYPISRCEIRRVGEKIRRTPQPISQIHVYLLNFFSWLFSFLTLTKNLKAYVDELHWQYTFSPSDNASKRNNTLIYVELGNDLPAVATYHMPCAYKTPEVMRLHIEALISILEELKGQKELILTGDFNIEPQSDHYELLARKFHPAYNSHPKSTCYAATVNNPDGWSGCLDYIFLSDGLYVTEVLPVAEPKELLPNAEEPSDHLMIGARISW